MLSILPGSLPFIAATGSPLRVDPLNSRAPEIQAVGSALGSQMPNFTDKDSTEPINFRRKKKRSRKPLECPASSYPH
ncbi:hypothetical protein F4824DRAFT_454893 [Ustulina deusta]|nr:hypothetical protein F4824DRAFT_454893 [Ustulina deusta]